MTTTQGIPCWYELSTTDIAAAQKFYASVLGWSWIDSGMAGFDYKLAQIAGDTVAGAMTGEAGGPPPMWSIYFAVDDCDRTVAAITADGGKVIVPPTDIPNTGRFAHLTDPQGAAFGILQPLPMADAAGSRPFDQAKPGHGNWNELITTDARAALAFYGKHFGWTPSRAMEMGPDLTYHLFAHNGADIGGMMTFMPGMPGPGRPFWQPYFGVEGADSAIARITSGGGTVRHGPAEVPGGAWIVQATDPQGAGFAVVGPK